MGNCNKQETKEAALSICGYNSQVAFFTCSDCISEEVRRDCNQTVTSYVTY